MGRPFPGFFVNPFQDWEDPKIPPSSFSRPSANVFVFGDFNIHHKDWLTYSGGTDRPGQLCYNLSISNELTQMVNFSTRIPNCALMVLLFWTYFFLLVLVFVLQWLSLHRESLIMFLSQFPLTFHKSQNGMLHSSHST